MEVCRSYNSKATLVSIHSRDENDHVYSLIYQTGLNAWIGGYDTSTAHLQTSTSWAWQDGSVFDYSNWANGDPNELIRPNGIYMRGRSELQPGRWDDFPPTGRKSGYICAYNL